MASEIAEPRIYRSEVGACIVGVVLIALGAAAAYWVTRKGLLAVFILWFEIPFVAGLWLTHVRLTVDRNGIEWRRFGRTVAIPWPQIRQVHTGPDDLTISDGFQSIRIQREHRWFDELHETLRRNAPQEAIEGATRFPFTMPASNIRRYEAWLAVGMVAPWVVFTGWKAGDIRMVLFLHAMLSLIVIMTCFLPTSYKFSRQGLETIAPLRRKTYLWDNFETVQYRCGQGLRETILKFTNGRVILIERSISTAHAQVIESLKKELGPRYREEPGPLSSHQTKA